MTSTTTLSRLLTSLPQRFSMIAGGYAPARSAAEGACDALPAGECPGSAATALAAGVPAGDPGTAAAEAGSAEAGRALPDGVPADGAYEEVDVAIVMESTYPYLKGGVSAVVHDIISGNPDLSYGIIHITWDHDSPSKDLYGMPDNVRWVRPLYLSMEDHPDFTAARPRDLRMSHKQRLALARRTIGALKALAAGDVDPVWDLVHDGLAESTRSFPLWALLGTSEFMDTYREEMPTLGMSLSELFWCLRDFFSLAYAVLGETMPPAKVYHAHTTGYAALLAANASREHGASYLLTEHNLYVRDTVNTLLDRRMDKKVTLRDYREFDVTGRERMWMAWWLEMGRMCYPDAYATTYLYPEAVRDAEALATDPSKANIIPNGIVTSEFDAAWRTRQQQTAELRAEGPENHVWRLAYIARVVPIKGLLDLIESMRMLRERGVRFHLDVCGPTEHMPDYYEQCVARIAELGLEDWITIRGTIKVRECLGDWDVFVLPSYNEGLPCVSLETMGAGIPTVSTDVGAVRSVVETTIHGKDGSVWGPCGFVIEPGDPTAMADRVEELVSDVDLFERMSKASRGRVEAAYDLIEVNATYHELYIRGGAVGDATAREAIARAEEAARAECEGAEAGADGANAAGPAEAEPTAAELAAARREALEALQETTRAASLVR